MGVSSHTCTPSIDTINELPLDANGIRVGGLGGQGEKGGWGLSLQSSIQTLKKIDCVHV